MLLLLLIVTGVRLLFPLGLFPSLGRKNMHPPEILELVKLDLFELEVRVQIFLDS